MKRKVGIFAGCLGKEIPMVDQVEMIKNAGFEVFASGLRDSDVIAGMKEKADRLGLFFEEIHAPFANINSMWIPGLDYLDVYNNAKQSIDLAARHGIPSIVLHVSSGWYPPGISDLGLQRYDELVFYAAEKGVNVAFENLRCVGNLAYFADRYEKLENVRFCYDFGHEHCYTATVTWMDIFCDKLVCTHIHDNYGRTDGKNNDPDLHLLPFEGNTDYQHCIDKLDEYGYTGPLTLELSHSTYAHLSPEDFLKTCYERVQRINTLSKA
jgi:sugar phosphate isomerase/epimerase